MADPNKLKNLLSTNRINKDEYDIYLVFEMFDLGRLLLKNMCDAVLLEEPLDMRGVTFAWHDGRRSCWRHIKLIINKVESLLLTEGVNDDRDGSRYNCINDI